MEFQVYAGRVHKDAVLVLVSKLVTSFAYQ